MTDRTRSSVAFTLVEPADTPWLGMFFGYVAMVPFAIGVLAFWLAGEPWRGAALAVTLFWGCAILTFLSGVRRGLSFRTPGGVRAAQIATMLWLFCVDEVAWASPRNLVQFHEGEKQDGVGFPTPSCLGFAAIVLTAVALPVWATALLLVGYFSLQVLDPIAARKLETPLYFARLRPAQMAIPLLCILATLVVPVR